MINSHPLSLFNSTWYLNFFLHLQETMRRRVRATFIFALLALFLFAFFSLHLSRYQILKKDIQNLTPRPLHTINYAILDNPPPPHVPELSHLRTRHVSSIGDSIATISVLLPAWEVLVIASPDFAQLDYSCLFQNKHTSPATFSGVLPFTNRTTFKCLLPNSVRRLRPFFQPVLIRSSEVDQSPVKTAELIRWNFMAYESFSTEHDVVLFVKGVNNRQGTKRSPSEFRCVFGDGSVKTSVTSSIQEVFRCPHPELRVDEERIKISLEIVAKNVVVPTLAYYTPPRPTKEAHKSLLCACTMVYNVAKFLREWVMYHSKIGVQNFILYDNGSDDDLPKVVNELNEEGYNVTTIFWIWPKTQEAGFSHSAIYANHSCTWIMYLDVDEFLFSPTSSNNILSSHLLKTSQHRWNIGQVMIRCNEFGPSNQTSHPVEGVTQGYTCRRKIEQRHKSIVLLNAVDLSLMNVIHHFELKDNFRSKQIGTEKLVVNHYKYQAWSEFRTKFRRRVSAYVVDWMQAVNPMSKDRTPGLGFDPIEPKGWANKFCEVRDDGLKLLTQKWFGSNSNVSHQHTMAWAAKDI